MPFYGVLSVEIVSWYSMWRLLVVPYYRLLLEKSSLAKDVEFITGTVLRVLAVELVS